MEKQIHELEAFRRANNWTRREMAEKIGTTATSVYRHERRSVRPKDDVLANIIILTGGAINANHFMRHSNN